MKQSPKACKCGGEAREDNRPSVEVGAIIKPKEKQADRRRREAAEKTGKAREANARELQVLQDAKEAHAGEGLLSVSKKNVKEVWKVIEAAVDSGAVDTVGNPNEFPGATIKETRESKNDECWISANGDEIPKLGEMDIKFQTNDGQNLR